MAKESELNLNNLKKLRDIYAEAIDTGDVPDRLRLGICSAYLDYFDCANMYDVFDKYYRGGYAYNYSLYAWPIVKYGATIDQSLKPRLEWLDNKIKDMEANND